MSKEPDLILSEEESNLMLMKERLRTGDYEKDKKGNIIMKEKPDSKCSTLSELKYKLSAVAKKRDNSGKGFFIVEYEDLKSWFRKQIVSLEKEYEKELTKKAGNTAQEKGSTLRRFKIRGQINWIKKNILPQRYESPNKENISGVMCLGILGLNDCIKKIIEFTKCPCYDWCRQRIAFKCCSEECWLREYYEKGKESAIEDLKIEADRISFKVTCVNCDPEELGEKFVGMCPACNNTRLYKMIPYDTIFTNLWLNRGKGLLEIERWLE